MKKFFLTLLFFGCAHNTAPHTSLPFQPQLPQIIEHEGFTLAYDGRIRGANWVYETLTPNTVSGTATRTHFDFQEDPLIPKPLRASKADFKGSGFDRGHLRPAANARISEQAMHDTFYLSNISPQHPQLNRAYWVKLEKYVRDKVKLYDILYVITGPLFLPRKEPDGKWYVRYEVIGDSNVAVPTHYFKVLHGKKGLKVTTEAFILPNTPIAATTSLKQFSVSLEKVERAAGLIFQRE